MASASTISVDTTLAVTELSIGGQAGAAGGAEEVSVPVERQRRGERGRVTGRVRLAVQRGQHHPADRCEEQQAEQPGEQAEQRSTAAAWSSDGDSGGSHRFVSSRNRDSTTRNANVAMMIEPSTTTTPAAEARP
ncbi:hypothetical protein GCM10027614_71820 [Micromonospora vulcania]